MLTRDVADLELGEKVREIQIEGCDWLRAEMTHGMVDSDLV